MQRLPTAEEHRCGYGSDYKHIHILCQIEKAESDTRILGMVACRQLRLCLGQVERTAVGLGVSRYQIYHKNNESRDAAFEEL